MLQHKTMFSLRHKKKRCLPSKPMTCSSSCWFSLPIHHIDSNAYINQTKVPNSGMTLFSHSPSYCNRMCWNHSHPSTAKTQDATMGGYLTSRLFTWTNMSTNEGLSTIASSCCTQEAKTNEDFQHVFMREPKPEPSMDATQGTPASSDYQNAQVGRTAHPLIACSSRVGVPQAFPPPNQNPSQISCPHMPFYLIHPFVVVHQVRVLWWSGWLGHNYKKRRIALELSLCDRVEERCRRALVRALWRDWEPLVCDIFVILRFRVCLGSGCKIIHP